MSKTEVFEIANHTIVTVNVDSNGVYLGVSFAPIRSVPVVPKPEPDTCTHSYVGTCEKCTPKEVQIVQVQVYLFLCTVSIGGDGI